ncbi:MAG: membrane dipeptidase [Phenylobacterium sp.]|nr:membrane dipeptidase [Phenylobacterium sp.]
MSTTDPQAQPMAPSRRALLTLAAAVPVAFAGRHASATPAEWKDAIIVNALGGLGNPNNRRDDEDSAVARGQRRPRRLDARTLSDARASGVTAVNCTLGYVAGAGDPYEVSVASVAQYDRMVREQSADLLKIYTADDILRAKRENKIGLIYGFQNAAMVGDNLDRIDVFNDLGVRIIQLTYNPANHIGDGSMAPQNRGLTPFGRQVVERLNDARIMVDLSHSGQNTCLEAAKISKQPISINHTGCRALTDLPRNKTDEELKLVADRGGFVGIYFMPFLNREGKVRAVDIVEHIEHALKVCGEDVVGLGTDGPITQIDDMESYKVALAKEVADRKARGIGATGEGPETYPFAIDLRGPTQFYDLAGRLKARGHSTGRIEKILGGNFVRYAKDIWGA